MKNRRGISCIITLAAMLLLTLKTSAQSDIFVNMALLDGIGLTPDNLLNYQIQSNMPKAYRAHITGSIRYRQSALNITYQYDCTLQPGLNNMSSLGIRPEIKYSESSLRELFEQYKLLPQGIYEYCVSVSPPSAEVGAAAYSECIYHKSEDIFLINLIDPDNDAKLYEYNPMLSWAVNYPFASALSYRLRVAEIKEGQNNTIAINRNSAIYDEKNLMQLSQIYPVYAKPLKLNQPYAWTVDAYYKGILLGGAEPWRFTIIEDSLLVAVPSNQSYYDFAAHQGETSIYAIDTIKLKYQSYGSIDTFSINITDVKGAEVKFKTTQLPIHAGTNLIDLSIPGNAWLRHFGHYSLKINTKDGQSYIVPFIYVNPLYLKTEKE